MPTSSADAVEQHDELVAGEPRGGVALADHARSRAGDDPQELVSGGVAEGVVDVLEAVDVDVQGRDRRSARAAPARASARRGRARARGWAGRSARRAAPDGAADPSSPRPSRAPGSRASRSEQQQEQDERDQRADREHERACEPRDSAVDGPARGSPRANRPSIRARACGSMHRAPPNARADATDAARSPPGIAVIRARREARVARPAVDAAAEASKVADDPADERAAALGDGRPAAPRQ